MQKIINYLFSGKIELQDLSLTDLIKLMKMASMMVLDELLAGTQSFVLGFLPNIRVNYGSIPELLDALIMAEQFHLTKIKHAIDHELYRVLKDIPHIPEVVQDSEAFKRLPVDLLKNLLVGGYDDDDNDGQDYPFDYPFAYDEGPSAKDTFDAFVFWLSGNEIKEKEKKLILDNFKLDDFTGEELLDVRKSGLFSIEEIDEQLTEILKADDVGLFVLNAKDKEIDSLKKEVKKLKEGLAKK